MHIYSQAQTLHIQILECFLYVTTIINLFERNIVSWSINMEVIANDTIIATLSMIIKQRKSARDIMLHSD